MNGVSHTEPQNLKTGDTDCVHTPIAEPHPVSAPRCERNPSSCQGTPQGAPQSAPSGGPAAHQGPALTTSCLPVLDLGLAPYLPVQALQQRLRHAVADGCLRGVILLLEHEPVITLGSRGAWSDLRDQALLASRQVAVITSERGGQATLHAPGQLVSYPIVPIPGKDLTAYVRALEEVILRLLDRLEVAGYRRPGHPGVYVAGEKIASVGLRCQRWVASHGTSLNVNLDLSLFDLIVSCGEPHLRQTSLEATCGRDPGMALVKRLWTEAAAEVFGWVFSPIVSLDWSEVEAWLGVPDR